MRKLFAMLVAIMLLATSTAISEALDLSSFTDAELEGLKSAIKLEREVRSENKAKASTTHEVDLSDDGEPAFQPIENGSWNEDVRALQDKLIELDLLNSKADGIFGPRTESALKELQSALGMEATGIVETQAEWNALMAAEESDGVITSVDCENLLAGFGEDYVENNGVTFVKNADGSVTANGTATGGNAVYMIMKRDQVISALAKYNGQNMIGTGCPEGGSTSESYWLNFQGFTGVGDGIGTPDTGSGSIFTADISEDYNTMQVYFAIHEGMTVENLIFAPVLRLNVE